MTFYNTIELKDPELTKARVRAKSQESMIYSIMIFSGKDWTAWQLKEIFPDWEITSIRRALFNMEKKEGKIEQIDFVPGPKGKPVGRYRASKQVKMF